MNAPLKNSRRLFLKHSTGLVIGFSSVPALLAQNNTTPPLPGSLAGNPQIDSWLYINPKGIVTVYSGKVEFGQGITTALKQIVADELDLDINRIEMIPTTTGLSPNEGVTSGSQSVEFGGLALRYACAQAKGTLLEKAATQLGVPQSELRVSDGNILAKSGQSTSYWSLTEDKLLNQRANLKYKPKDASAHYYIGISVPRVDIPAKVSGGAAYVQDMRMHGMLHARVVRPPAPRAQLLSIDEVKIKALPGVVGLVRDGSFLAIVAKREEQAIKALDLAKSLAKWDLKNDLPASYKDWHASMKKINGVVTEHAVKSNPSNPAVKTLVGEYTKPFIMHGSIGPSCALAIMNQGIMKIYTHSQGMYPLQTDLVKALGMPPEKIICIHTEGSGMYGQSGADDVALDAALVARAFPEKPIRMHWTREEEMKWEPFGSAMSMKVAAYAIALNEEKHAQRWADTTKDADFRLVCDTGSTDKTVEILRSNGVIVYEISVKPWRFDVARNTAQSLLPADIDVCLSLDLDETVDEDFFEIDDEALNKENSSNKTNDDYSTFELVMLYDNKIKLMDILHKIKQKYSLETTEESLMTLIFKYKF